MSITLNVIKACHINASQKYGVNQRGVKKRCNEAALNCGGIGIIKYAWLESIEEWR
jgi:hypothetical protein